MSGGTNTGTGMGSAKPMVTPMGSQIQMASPWGGGQPPWATNSYSPPTSPLPTSTAEGDTGTTWRPPGGGNDVENAPVRRVVYNKPPVLPQPTMPTAGVYPSWRMPMMPSGLTDPSVLPGWQGQFAQQIGLPQPPAPTPTPAPAPAPSTPTPTTPVPNPTAPTQSAVSTAIGSSIDPSVMAGLSAQEKANYQLDPDSRTWIRVR